MTIRLNGSTARAFTWLAAFVFVLLSGTQARAEGSDDIDEGTRSVAKVDTKKIAALRAEAIGQAGRCSACGEWEVTAKNARWRVIIRKSRSPAWDVEAVIIDPGFLSLAGFEVGQPTGRWRLGANGRYEGEALWQNLFGIGNWYPAQLTVVDSRSLIQTNQPAIPSFIGTEFRAQAMHPPIKTQIAAAPSPARPARPVAPKPVKAAPATVRPARRPAPAANDSKGPEIVIPARLTAAGEWAEFSGSVTDSSGVARVLVDGQEVGVRSDGSFQVRRRLDPGKNVLQIKAIDQRGNHSISEVIAFRQGSGRNAPATPAKALDYGRFHALVVGNNEYRGLPKLLTAVNDARAVSRVLLNQYGFDVTTITNGTRNEIVRALNKYRRELEPDDNLLIYYAGHGYVDPETSEGYWLPVDAEREDSLNWVSNSTITTALKGMQARHVMVVADSCYSGSLTRGITQTPPRRFDYLTRIRSKQARVVITSGGMEPVADGGGDGHSVFTRHFVQALQSNSEVMEGAQLFLRLKRPVIENARQTPEYGTILYTGHDGGDFLFIKR